MLKFAPNIWPSIEYQSNLSLIWPTLLQWKYGLKRGVGSVEGDNIVDTSTVKPV
jgi:hypothetical protein